MTKSISIFKPALAALLASAVSLSAALAGTVDIKVGPKAGAVSVDARDATTLEIITKLGERFKFDVHQKSDTAGSTVRTGQWSGTLEDVLRRILRTENHVVAGSVKAPTSVTLMDAGSKTAVAPMPAPSAPPPPSVTGSTTGTGSTAGTGSSGMTPNPSVAALGPGSTGGMPRPAEPAAEQTPEEVYPPGSVQEATMGGPRIPRPSDEQLAAMQEARMEAWRLDPSQPEPGSVLEATTGGPKPTPLTDAEIAAIQAARWEVARMNPNAPPPGSVLEATTGGPTPPPIDPNAPLPVRPTPPRGSVQ